MAPQDNNPYGNAGTGADGKDANDPTEYMGQANASRFSAPSAENDAAQGEGKNPEPPQYRRQDEQSTQVFGSSGAGNAVGGQNGSPYGSPYGQQGNQDLSLIHI